jgi:hypothetical protein
MCSSELQKQHLQSAGRRNPGHITCHSATALHTNYRLWSPHPFPHTLQHLSNHPCGELTWKPHTVKRALQNKRSPWHLQRPFVSAPPSGKCILVRTPDTLASVTSFTTTPASRRQHKRECSSSRHCQRSSGQPAVTGASLAS